MAYIVVGVIILALIIVIINKIKNQSYVTVTGKIIKFVEEDGNHYPVFSFNTVDGKTINKRCFIKVGNETKDSSVEIAYGSESEYAIELLKKPLPIENIPIKYNKNNPDDFIAKWI